MDDLDRIEKKACWIVDPLDGTREFTLGIPEFCVSVAFVLDGEALVGSSTTPFEKNCLAALLEQAHGSITRPSRSPTMALLKNARVVCSRSEIKKGWFDDWKSDLDLNPVGSVAYKLGLVAAGLAEASFTPRPRNAWDVAGGVAILHAAGGQASNRLGKPYTFNTPTPLKNGVCATNGHLHPAILEIMDTQAQSNAS